MKAGDTIVDTGKWIETFHRGEDVEWRMTNDIWNSDVPASDPNAHIVILHEVDDADHWLAAWRGEDSRHKLFTDNGAANVTTFQDGENTHLTGLVVSVSDMDALNAMLESEEGQAAAAEDGVRMDILPVLTEVE